MANNEARSTTLYYEDVGKNAVIAGAEEEADLIVRWRKKRDIKARDRLISGHLRYVVKIARQYTRDAERLPDLIAAGNIGLMIALERYDLERLPKKAQEYTPGVPKKQVRFIVYATWWIRESIRQEEYGQLLAHVPVHRQKAFRRKMKEALTSGGPMPEPDAVQVSLSSFMRRGGDRDITDDDGDRLTRYAMVAGSSEIEEVLSEGAPDEKAEYGSIRLLVQRSMDCLTPREQTVLNCYYGLRDEARTLPQIASLLGLSDERVRQIKIQAMERIKETLRPAVQALSAD